MIGRKLLDYVDLENRLLPRKFGLGFKEYVLVMVVKLTEELGELCNDVLAFFGVQRREKLSKYDKENLALEIADVIIAALILARALEVDVNEALEKKIGKNLDNHKTKGGDRPLGSEE